MKMNYKIFLIGFVLKVVVLSHCFTFGQISEQKNSNELSDSLGNGREELLLGNVREKRDNNNQVHIHVHINNGNNEKDLNDNDMNGKNNQDIEGEVEDEEDNRRREKQNRRRKRKKRQRRRKCQKHDHKKKCNRHSVTTPSTTSNTTEQLPHRTEDSSERSEDSYVSTTEIEYTNTPYYRTSGTVPPTEPRTEAPTETPTEHTTKPSHEPPSKPTSASIPYYPPTEVNSHSGTDKTISDKDIQYRKAAEDEKHIVRDV